MDDCRMDAIYCEEYAKRYLEKLVAKLEGDLSTAATEQKQLQEQITQITADLQTIQANEEKERGLKRAALKKLAELISLHKQNTFKTQARGDDGASFRVPDFVGDDEWKEILASNDLMAMEKRVEAALAHRMAQRRRCRHSVVMQQRRQIARLQTTLRCSDDDEQQ